MKDQNSVGHTIAAWAAVIIFIVVLFAIPRGALGSHAVNHQDDDPYIVQWYKSLKLMHDVEGDSRVSSCCGEADAYWCDDLGKERDEQGEVQVYCKITDDRVIYGRTPIPSGTKIIIPPERMRVATVDASNILHPYPGNPTGHSIVFLNSSGTTVYCFVPGTLG